MTVNGTGIRRTVRQQNGAMAPVAPRDRGAGGGKPPPTGGARQGVTDPAQPPTRRQPADAGVGTLRGPAPPSRPAAARPLRAPRLRPQRAPATAQRPGATPQRATPHAAAASARGLPVRPAESAAQRPAGALAPRPDTAAAAHPAAARTPFVFLLVGLLSGGLICLLLLNTVLAAGAFQVTNLQNQNATLVRQQQALQQQILYAESPGAVAQRAKKLGMIPVSHPRFVNVKTGRIYGPPPPPVVRTGN